MFDQHSWTIFAQRALSQLRSSKHAADIEPRSCACSCLRSCDACHPNSALGCWDHTMRNSYPGLKAELIPTASRFSDPSGKRTSGWCSRSRCAGLSFTALLLFAAFLYYQLRVLQNGSHIVGAAEQIVKISLQGNKQQPVSASPSTQSTSAAAQQLLHTLLGPFLSSTAELEVPSRPLTQLLAQLRPCPNNCSGVGNCLGDLGVCQCPGGGCNEDGHDGATPTCVAVRSHCPII
jgi:hypothetical protein